jgi:hypothetical protein
MFFRFLLEKNERESSAAAAFSNGVHDSNFTTTRRRWNFETKKKRRRGKSRIEDGLLHCWPSREENTNCSNNDEMQRESSSKSAKRIINLYSLLDSIILQAQIPFKMANV